MCVCACGYEYIKIMLVSRDAEAVVHAKVDANKLQLCRVLQYFFVCVCFYFFSLSPCCYLIVVFYDKNTKLRLGAELHS